MKYSVLTMCFLPPGDAVYDDFSRLGHKLRSLDLELVICCTDPGLERDGFTTITIPFLLRDHAARFSNTVSASGLPVTGAILRELMDLDGDWSGAPVTSATELSVQKAGVFWAAALEVIGPCAVLAWGSTAPFSRLMARLAQVANIPVYILERGWFEHTLSLGVLGQGPFGDAVIDIAYQYDDRARALRDETWGGIQSYYAASLTRHYETFNRPVDSGWLADAEARPSTKVLFIGSNDNGAGNALHGFRGSERYAMWVKNSFDAANAVAASLERIDGDIEFWYKPHPGKNFDLALDRVRERTVKKFESEDIYALIQAADVVATIGSTAQCYTCLYNKPVVVLGNGFLLGHEADYHVSAPDSLDKALEDALARRDFDDKLGRGRAAICALYDRNFIGLNDEVPTRRKLDDLAHLLQGLKTFALPQDWSEKQAALADMITIATGEGTLEALNDEVARLKVETAESLALVLPLQAETVELRGVVESEREARAAVAVELERERDERAGHLQALAMAEVRITELSDQVHEGATELRERIEVERGSQAALATELARERDARAQTELALAAAGTRIAELSAQASERAVELREVIAVERGAQASLAAYLARERDEHAQTRLTLAAAESRIPELSQKVSDGAGELRAAMEAGRAAQDALAAELAREREARAQSELALAAASARITELSARVSEETGELARVRKAAASDRDAAVRKATELRAQLTGTRAEFAGAVAEARAQRAASDEHIATLKAEVSATRSEFDRVREEAAKDRVAAEDRITEFAAMMANTQDALAGARKDASRERAALEAQLADAVRETWNVTSRLSEAWATLEAERATIARLVEQAAQTEAELTRTRAAADAERDMLNERVAEATREGWALSERLGEAWASLDAALDTARLDGFAAQQQAVEARQAQDAAHAEQVEALCQLHKEELAAVSDLLARYRDADAGDYVRWAVKRGERP